VYNNNPTSQEWRKMTSAVSKQLHQEQFLSKAVSLERQSAWTGWMETALPFDLSWKNLIYGHISPPLVKFLLNATGNTVPTPALRKLWGYKSHDCCPLCGAPKCTLHHILSNCAIALSQGRFTGGTTPC